MLNYFLIKFAMSNISLLGILRGNMVFIYLLPLPAIFYT